VSLPGHYPNLSTVDICMAAETIDQVFAGTHRLCYRATAARRCCLGPTSPAHQRAGGARFATEYGSCAPPCGGVTAGSHVVAALDLYGATFTLLSSFFASLGVTPHFVDVTGLPAVEAALEERRPVVLLVETISNPLLKVANVPALAELAHRYDVRLLVDNTFATPYLFNPIAHGADLVVHSATKCLSGHGDVMAGVVVTSLAVRQKLYEINKLVGGTLGPFEAWLALRGLKTLPLRSDSSARTPPVWLTGWATTHLSKSLCGSARSPQHDLATSSQAKGMEAYFSNRRRRPEGCLSHGFLAVRPATTLGISTGCCTRRFPPQPERGRASSGDYRGLVRLH
jgi:hypothetical protein